MRRTRGLVLCVFVAAVAAAAAGAVGPSPGVVQGGDGVLALSGDVRYVAMSNASSTTISAIRVRDGRVLAFASYAGNYGIPAVTVSRAVGGLSHDGRTLILGEPATGPDLRKQSRFLVLSTPKLRLVDALVLKGDFGFDALSPDARTLYLIEHASSSDVFRYAVRAYDLRARKLVATPVVDKAEPDESMSGYPVQRATSADGAWVYTLYQRSNSGKPFVHALDTLHRAAVCVDLPWRGSTDGIFNARLALVDGGAHLVISASGTRLATIDTRTFKVS
jgi:hypothetical protein